LTLNRGDVDDHAGALCEHCRQKRAVQPDGRIQIQVEGALPLGIRRKATGGRRRSADDMDHNVDPAETSAHGLGDRRTALRCGHIGGHELRAIGKSAWCDPGCAEDGRTIFTQSSYDCLADALARARDEGSQTVQFAFRH
jgi:hypothetical protein